MRAVERPSVPAWARCAVAGLIALPLAAAWARPTPAVSGPPPTVATTVNAPLQETRLACTSALQDDGKIDGPSGGRTNPQKPVPDLVTPRGAADVDAKALARVRYSAGNVDGLADAEWGTWRVRQMQITVHGGVAASAPVLHRRLVRFHGDSRSVTRNLSLTVPAAAAAAEGWLLVLRAEGLLTAPIGRPTNRVLVTTCALPLQRS